MKRFEDLQAWQAARTLVNMIYEITKTEPLKTNFGLKDQVQRASVSAMSNIAEGFARINRREKIQLYNEHRQRKSEAFFTFLKIKSWPIQRISPNAVISWIGWEL